MDYSNLTDLVEDYLKWEIDETDCFLMLFKDNEFYFARDSDFHLRVTFDKEPGVESPVGIFFERFEIKKRIVNNIDFTRTIELCLHLKEYSLVKVEKQDLPESLDVQLNRKISQQVQLEVNKQLIDFIKRDFNSNSSKDCLLRLTEGKKTSFEVCFSVFSNSKFKRIEVSHLEQYFGIMSKIGSIREECQTLLNTKRKRDFEVLFK